MIQIKNYNAPEYDFSEILRYARAGSDSFATLEGLIPEAESALSYKVCYTELPIEINGDTVNSPAFSVKSSDLAKNLSGCEKIIIFGATIGIGFDRLIAKYSSTSPSKAVLLQGMGAERIEALCNTFCRDMEAEYGKLRPRFSPGYGDLDISFQADIFSILDLSRKIGLTLNESLIMSPSKSVTAIVGIGRSCENIPSGCESCQKKYCEFKKEL